MTNNEYNKVNKGTILMLSTGEYSDYGIQTLSKAIKDFDIREVSEEYLSENEGQRGSYSCDFYKFTQWLIEKKYIETVEYKEWHLGDYGSFSLMSLF